MDNQIYNFIKILNTAFSSKEFELEAPDWQKLYFMAKSQAVLPVFNEGLAMYNAEPKIAQKCFSSALNQVSVQGQYTEEFLAAYKAITAKGIFPIVLKGMVCRYTYGELGDCRPSSDEDIYIKKRDFDGVKNVLLSLGYKPDDIQISPKVLEECQEISFVSPMGLKIEVHINLFGTENSERKIMNKYFENAFETMVSAEIHGEVIYTLDYTLNYLFLFFHLYKHFTCSGVGIRQVLDMCLFNRAFHDKIDFEYAEKAICQMKADRLYADAVKIGEELGFFVKTELKGYNPEMLLRDMCQSGVFGSSSIEHSRSRAVLLGATENKKAGMLKVIFPSAKTIQSGYPILNKGKWLLPIAWVQRWFRYLKNRKNGSYAKKSIEIGKQRYELMKKYGLLK